MPIEDNAEPIGDPVPAEGEKTRGLFGPISAVVVGTAGVLTFAAMNMPVRLLGASQSARLVWEQRQVEIEKAIAEQTPAKPAAETREATGNPPAK